ncbi:MAG: phenylalanine--tRNA ligase subunit beta [Oscillospiraceae bacterium]|nr:phenylalanine--tRNA ligase subunit beta [Oscillospiraceae bacterium]
MKVSLNWIKDYVKLPADMDLKKLAYDLTMSTVEVEDVEELGKKFDGIVVGVIKEVLPHPNADKLRICRTDIGGEIKEIVCGGSNLEVNQKVAVALPGTFVKWHGEGEPVEIKVSKLRGVESFGMICASTEIGLEPLFPLGGEHEILDLKDFECQAGDPIAKALNLDDVILEIDNKSMTNRPDLWGHYGIAREIATLYDLPLEPVEKFVPQVDGGVDVRIGNSERCRRFTATKIENVYVKESPFEIQSRLWRVGLRPINALVDITNYAMMASGQPSHAYDLNHIVDFIEARNAAEGEVLNLLNGEELKLNPDDLVIADATGPVGLAGVMGGAKDSILPQTTEVLLEIANFESMGVRRTSQRYDVRTDASSRYEKAIDPERVELGFNMAMALFAQLYPEMKVTGYVDQYPTPIEKPVIDVSLAWLERRLGQAFPNEYIENKLSRLGFEVTIDGDNLHVVTPSWRSTGDISERADIMEEVARIYGYDNIQATKITTTFDAAINQLDFDLSRKIKEYLAFRCNMQEVFTYPWMNDKTVEAIMGTTEGLLKLSTPPSPTEKFIRCSILPNICDTIAKNERFYNEFAVFEEAQTYLDKDYVSNYDEKEKIPHYTKAVGGAFTGSANDIVGLFRKAKGVLEMMPRYTHMEGFTFRKDEKPVWADNTVWLNIYVGDVKVGDMGLLAKKPSMECGIKNLAAILFELDFYKLVPFRSRTNEFKHLPEFPENNYDISLLFDVDTKWEKIYAEIMRKAKSEKLIKSASFVDEYRGKQIPQGKKSVTIRLVIGADDKTLTSEQIEKVAATVTRTLEHTAGAQTRF